MAPYLEALDVVFAFEALHAVGDPRSSCGHRGRPRDGEAGWVLSNHDFSRLVTAPASQRPRRHAVALCLPGPAFLFQGDEIGIADARLESPRSTATDVTPSGSPMLWEASAHGGFSIATPWLRAIAPGAPTVAEQERDPDSTLSLHRRLIELRARAGRDDRAAGLARGHDRRGPRHACGRGQPGRGAAPRAGVVGELVLEARPGDGRDPPVIPSPWRLDRKGLSHSIAFDGVEVF